MLVAGIMPMFLAIANLPSGARGVAGIIIAIGGLIFFHEFGHFLAAKRMKMPVEIFSMGFGPRLIGFKWKETDVRLSLLPLGGYVKLAGYNPEEPDAEDPHGFLQQPYRKRMLFYAGGILANLLAAFLLYCTLHTDNARILSWTTNSIECGQVLKGGRAEVGGLKEGDVIRRLGSLNYPQANWEETVAFIQSMPEKPVEVCIERKGKPITLTLIPANDGGKGKLGLGEFYRNETPANVRPLALKDVWTGVTDGAKHTAYQTLGVAYGLWRLVSFKAHLKEVGGPAAIGAMAYTAAQHGWRQYSLFVAFLSINLALLNALPIPFLDGGHMVILSFERLRRKDLSIRLKEQILTVGFFFLVGLMALVIALDIWRLKH